MSELYFPTLPGIAVERSRSPIWTSTVQQSVAGKKLGYTAQSFPLWAYTLAFNLLQAGAENELQSLIGLFNSCRGRARPFLFRDEEDGDVIDQGFGVGDGATTIFRLYRTFGGFAEPIAETQTVTDVKSGGVSKAFTALSGGRVQFSAPPANGALLTWAGSYYWRCRFDDDMLDFERFMVRLWQAKSVKFTSETT